MKIVVEKKWIGSCKSNGEAKMQSHNNDGKSFYYKTPEECLNLCKTIAGIKGCQFNEKFKVCFAYKDEILGAYEDWSFTGFTYISGNICWALSPTMI